MKRLTLILLCAALVALNAFGQGTPSSKATAAINTTVGCTVKSTSTTVGETLPVDCHDIFTNEPINTTPDNFAKIMSATIKVSNSQSLFVSPSLVTGLYTQTRTKSSPGSGASQAVAEGGVYLRAVIRDQAGKEQVAYPIQACDPANPILGCYADGNGKLGVVLNTRVQQLTQEISQCIVNSLPTATTPSTQIGTCTFDLTTDLMLKTTSAHTFNFIFPKVGVGVYTVEIQAAVNANATVPSGSGAAVGAAAYGLGSLTVESVRMVKEFAF